jgi:histidinol-phosphate/aromatic aminotransferase/cobyric acid decarboxylase-like protein
VNPNLAKLQPYPFERLRLLFKDITPDPRYSAINLGIGEPKHPTPEFIRQALTQNLSGLASYPATAGTPVLREAIAAWARRRYRLTGLDALTQVLPVNGSREALFALAQTVIDPGRGDGVVVCPNPFYQIYEGAALLAGATSYYVNGTYLGSAMGLPAQAASVAAWGDDAHVAENRRPMENTACTAQSSSNAWMPGPAPRPASTSCSGAIRRMRARNCRRNWRSKLLASGLSG